MKIGPSALALAALASVARAEGEPGSAAGRGGEADLRVVPEEVVVVGTRSPRAASSLPTTVTVVRREDLDRSAAATLDGALRALPSLATLRRSTSLAADPSSQGLNLRGVGPSAVSRTLLLDDGVPVNDPFAGWVAWRALPRLGIERVEVAPGGASALYGSAALGGVVALVPRAVTGSGLEVETSGGSFGTYGVAARGEHRSGAAAAALEAEHLGTDGYEVVAPDARGPVDGRAGARHASAALRLALEPARGPRLTLGGTFFDEDQDGGTRFTRAGLRWYGARAGLDARGRSGRLSLVLHGNARTFTQQRARVAEGRAAEEPAASQEVPSTDVGGSAVASLAARRGHVLSAGADLRRVAGESDERLFPPAAAPATSAVSRVASGTQWTGGAFVQDAWTVARSLELAGAVRLDLWRDEDGQATRALRDGTSARETFAPRTRTLVSPRVAARWSPAPPVTLRASGYRAFRAPTLNELYRPFQVGTVLTAPNPELRAEILTGAEAGPEIALGRAARLRATAFWSALDEPILTVTLPAPLADGATRRRENLGRAVVRGIEAEASVRLLPALFASAAWTWVDARLDSAPGRPDLEGKALPHDPAHRIAARLAFDRPDLLAAQVEVRSLSRAWEDDQNTLPLPAYAVVDVTLSRSVGRRVEAFLAAENLLDRRYLVGRAGVDTVGAPLLVRGGVRVRTGSTVRRARAPAASPSASAEGKG
jgi:outer membrane receptor protein involved in Fe transport